MRKIFIAVSVVSLLSLTSPAHAGVVGTKCSNSGATLISQGTQYVCKNMGGKLKWQNLPIIRSAKTHTDCMVKEAGMSGFTPEQLNRAGRICEKYRP